MYKTFSLLIKYSPAMAEDILDKCTSTAMVEAQNGQHNHFSMSAGGGPLIQSKVKLHSFDWTYLDPPPSLRIPIK